MKKLLLILFLSIGAVNSYAAGFIENAKVLDVRVDENGYGIITFDKVRTREPAACGNTYNSSLSFDTNTEGGKAILSIALSALVSGNEISAWGAGVCRQYTSLVETWTYGNIYRK